MEGGFMVRTGAEERKSRAEGMFTGWPKSIYIRLSPRANGKYLLRKAFFFSFGKKRHYVCGFCLMLV